MRSILYLFLLLVFISCSPSMDYSSNAILISNIQIIDVVNGEVKDNQHIVIDSGKMVKISDRPIQNFDFAENIDGTGKFVMPGLAEMHAHIPGPNDTDQWREDVLFLYLSQGITTIRGMLGDTIHLELRENANNGAILSPRIFTSSPSLNGNTVQSIGAADSLVRKYHSDGYDFLKIHPGIQLPVFDQIVETAHEVGIPFSGHVPVDVGIRHALKSQYASIDHVDGYLEGLVPQSLKVNPEENGFFGYDFTNMADTTMIGELMDMTKGNRVWIVPTQSLFERWFAPIPAKDLMSIEEIQYMPGSILRNWVRMKNQVTENDNFNSTQWSRFIHLRRKLIQSLSQSEPGLLLGSDAPQVFNVPGFSIHHEIDGMQKAGITNLEIIQSGTINPAIFFSQEDVFGQVKEGLRADLIITDKNPLMDLNTLQELYGVMWMGKWISKNEIAEKLERIAQRASGT